MFLMTDNKWARLLAYVTGLVNQKLLLQNEYLAAENRILRSHLPTRLRLSDPQRFTLAEIGKRLGRKALQQSTDHFRHSLTTADSRAAFPKKPLRFLRVQIHRNIEEFHQTDRARGQKAHSRRISMHLS